MPEVDGQEKTEQATGKKIQDTREKGQVARSAELNSLAVFSIGLLVLFLFKNHIGSKLSELSIFIFSSLDVLEVNLSILKIYAIKAALFFLITMSPLLAALVIISLVSGYGQVGFRITPKALIPNFGRMNPVKGIKNKFFSVTPWVELIKSIFKLLIIGGFSYFILSDMIINSVGLVDYSVEGIVYFMLDNSIDFLWKVSLVYAILAFADFAYQRHKHKKDLMMTKQEVKDEYKQTEGDPLIKGHIRRKQLEMAKSRMIKEIPTADVVITNPTHYAVALKYEMNRKSAPRVVAKGVDFLAQRIKEVAKENNVPVHEDVFLARALYKACDIGDEIPEKLYRAVAQILAYIYKQKNRKKKLSIV